MAAPSLNGDILDGLSTILDTCPPQNSACHSWYCQHWDPKFCKFEQRFAAQLDFLPSDLLNGQYRSRGWVKSDSVNKTKKAQDWLGTIDNLWLAFSHWSVVRLWVVAWFKVVPAVISKGETLSWGQTFRFWSRNSMIGNVKVNSADVLKTEAFYLTCQYFVYQKTRLTSNLGSTPTPLGTVPIECSRNYVCDAEVSFALVPSSKSSLGFSIGFN